MSDISGFGLRVSLIAASSFPQGIEISQFADDADPIDQSSIQIRDKAMGLNGQLISWSKANPILVTLNVIPNGEDDNHLQILALANMSMRKKRSAAEKITLTISYPDASNVSLQEGYLTDAMIGKPIASSGRMKTKSYGFAFETMSLS